MINLLTVMLGGAVGAGGRYLVGEALVSRTAVFPWGTLAINLLGGLLMGVLAGLVARGVTTDAARLLLGVGVLGGFTTFSAFSLDVVRLVERGEAAAAFGYLSVSVFGSILLTFLGLVLVRRA